MKKGDKEKGIRYYVPSSYMERLKKLSYEVSQFKHKNLFTITQQVFNQLHTFHKENEKQLAKGSFA